MSELYYNLLSQYKNKSYWIDDNGLMGVILFNEDPFTIKTMWVKFKYSKLSLVDGEYIMDIIAFVKYALSRGYDWRLYGKPEWQEIEPKKKTPFMKPRILIKEDKIISPEELVRKVMIKHAEPMKMYEVVNEIARTVALVPDGLKREIYAKQLSSEFNLDYSVLKNKIEFKHKNGKK